MVTRRGAILGALCAAVSSPAWAHDWTGSDNKALAEWFSSLHRIDDFSCCGLGDAYPCQILIEADPSKPFEDTGLVRITDGRELHLMNNTVERKYLPRGLEIKYAYHKITDEKSGNPTDTAWIFLSVYGEEGKSEVGKVYCVVPLPPSY